MDLKIFLFFLLSSHAFSWGVTGPKGSKGGKQVQTTLSIQKPVGLEKKHDSMKKSTTKPKDHRM